MARATERTAPVAESPHARSTLESSRPAGLVLVARQRGRRPVCSSARLYSPGGCGCVLLMAPVMAAAMGLAALSLGMHTGSAAIVAFCGVFAVISIAGGAFSCSEMLDDLNGGWRQERFAFYEAEINKPRGRGAALSPTTFEVSLYRDGESVANHRVDARLSVNAADWPEVALVLDEPMAEVRWYPKTRTLVGARDVDGPATAGDPIE